MVVGTYTGTALEMGGHVNWLLLAVGDVPRPGDEHAEALWKHSTFLLIAMKSTEHIEVCGLEGNGSLWPGKHFWTSCSARGEKAKGTRGREGSLHEQNEAKRVIISVAVPIDHLRRFKWFPSPFFLFAIQSLPGDIGSLRF